MADFMGKGEASAVCMGERVDHDFAWAARFFDDHAVRAAIK